MKVGDPTDTLFADGVLVPGTPEEMQQQEEAAKQKLAELHKQRLEAARVPLPMSGLLVKSTIVDYGID